jgi:hypothetical protein
VADLEPGEEALSQIRDSEAPTVDVEADLFAPDPEPRHDQSAEPVTIKRRGRPPVPLDVQRRKARERARRYRARRRASRKTIPLGPDAPDTGESSA